MSPVPPAPPRTETQTLMEAGQVFYPSFTCEEARAYKIEGTCPRTSDLPPKWQRQDSNAGYVIKAQRQGCGETRAKAKNRVGIPASQLSTL